MAVGFPGFLVKAVALGAGLALVGAIAVYAASEARLRRTVDGPQTTPAAAVHPDMAEGLRMSRILGCWSGCHGRDGEGGSIDMAGYYSVTAPTLSAVLPDYSDGELVRLVRFGIKRDGTSALGMTAYTFYPLSDADLGNVIAHLRAQPARTPVPRHRRIGLRARWELLAGGWKPAADQVDRTRPRWGELPRNTPFERGRYLASVTCTECHGVDFNGNEFRDNTFDGGPTLAIVAAYDLPSFRALLRTGTGLGGRDLGEMSWVARNGFVHFTDGEISDIHAFLRQYHCAPTDAATAGNPRSGVDCR